MTTETELRERLARATEYVEGGPRLDDVLSHGRRARSRRRLASVAGAVAVLAVVGAGAEVVRHLGSAPERQQNPASQAPPATDFVPGSDVDETMQAVAALHVPALGQADDVFVSDWDHNGKMPDSRVADATDWQAVYTVGNTQLRLFMGYPKPDEPTGCGDCPTHAVPGGSVSTDASALLDPPDGLPWHFNTMFVADDGFTVVATEMVPGADEAAASANRQLDPQALEDLVTDARLTFPKPAR